MKRIVIASHSRFAIGLKETLTFLTTIDDIYDISAYIEEESEPLEDKIKELFEQFDNNDKVIVMTDMLSGSVNQSFYSYINDNVFVVTGVNVPLALELLLASEDDICYDFINNTVEEAKNMMIFVNSMQISQSEDDE